MDPSPFTPGATAALAATNTTSNVALPSGGGSRFLLQYNGTAMLFFNTGSSSVAATTSNTPLVPGAVKVFTLDPGATYIAAIIGTGGTAGNLYITRGEGN